MNSNILLNKQNSKSKILKFESIRICLASPERIKEWAKENKMNFEVEFDIFIFIK